MVKIVCTLGPVSSSNPVLLRMMRCGMAIARLNFSHGSLKDHRDRINKIRALNRRYRYHVKTLGDLEGYRLRVGKLKNGAPIEVKRGQTVYLARGISCGQGKVIPFDYEGPLELIRKGQEIYIDDGNIALVAKGRKKLCLECRVITPGLIKEHKGINMPRVRLPFKGLTEKDKADIDFCAEQGVDYIAQSFVRNKNDILDLKSHLKARRFEAQVIAKIENCEGIKNIDEIIGVTDGVMIARGDMGISVPIYKVPVFQKEIINKCNFRKKFVITATQMLESMTENRIPTRAEVSDVANAVLDGSDYLMLSAETAVGKYPVGSLDMMRKIINFTQRYF